MRWCFEHDCFEQAPAAWRTTCLQVGMVLRDQSNGSVLFCFGADLLMATFWSLDIMEFGAHKLLSFRELRTAGELVFSLMTGFKRFAAIPTRWVSPLHMFLLHGKQPLKALPMSALLAKGKDKYFLTRHRVRGPYGAHHPEYLRRGALPGGGQRRQCCG